MDIKIFLSVFAGCFIGTFLYHAMKFLFVKIKKRARRQIVLEPNIEDYR